MVWLLHFRGEGYGVMQGTSEYVILAEDDEEELKESSVPAPGFELISKTDLDIEEPPSNIPYNRALVPLLEV